MWGDVATLVNLEKDVDGDGFEQPRILGKREVFVNVKSVRRGEFYAARQSGTDVVIAFEVRAVDYNDEALIEYTAKGEKKPTTYRVIRDYTKSGEIYELNCALHAVPGSVARKVANRW